MTNLALSITIGAKNLARSGLEQVRQGLDRVEGAAKRVQRAGGMAFDQIDRLGNRWTALATGAGGAATLRYLFNLDERMIRMGIQAGKTADEMERVKARIFEVAQQGNIRIDPAQLLDAFDAVIEKTGDLDYALANSVLFGRAIQATGASGSAIGEIGAEFQKMGLSAKESAEALDTLNRQGKMGAFTLQNLAALGPRVISAYSATGRTGVQAMREMGAVLQVIRQGLSSPEQAATAWEALLRTLQDGQKLKLLAKMGVQVFDPERLKKGEKALRPINELMVDIVKASGGDMVKLGAVFDAEAMRAFGSAIGEYKRTGSVESLGKFMAVMGDGSETLKDSERAAKSANAAMTSLRTAWERFSDKRLTAPIQGMAGALSMLSADSADAAIGIGLAGAAALVAGAKWRKYRKLGQAAGAASGALSPIPVYIVNGPGAAALGGGAVPVPRGKGGRGWARGGKALPWLAAGLGAWEIGSALLDDTQGLERGRSVGGALGSVAGAGGGWMAGAAAGAALGSVVPVLGTATGGLLGGLLGAYGGGKLGGMLGGKGGELVVRFENAPPGMRIAQMNGEGLKADVSLGMMGAI